MTGCAGDKLWSAPETIRKHFYSAKCDSYSVGLILTYMLRANDGADKCETETPIEAWENLDKSTLEPDHLEFI